MKGRVHVYVLKVIKNRKKLLEIEQEILSQNEGLRQEIRMLQAFKVLKRDQHFDL